MAPSMDIGFLVDCTSSVASSFCQVRDQISSIIEPILYGKKDIRSALIEFRSCDDSWVTIRHPFTHSVNSFQNWLNNTQPVGGSQDGTRAISKKEKDFLFIFLLIIFQKMLFKKLLNLNGVQM